MKTDWYRSSVSSSSGSFSMMIVSLASLMVVLKKCGSSLADLHNARGFESKILCTLTLDMANTPLVTCPPVILRWKLLIFIWFYSYFYFVSLLLLFDFFIILVLSQGSGGLRVGPVWFRVVPARFPQVPVGSEWVPRYTHIRFNDKVS